MKIVEPWIEVEKIDGIKIMKRIERACRTCYRSEGSITEDSYKNLLKNCINRGHESVLEHEKVTIRMYCDIGVYKDFYYFYICWINTFYFISIFIFIIATISC